MAEGRGGQFGAIFFSLRTLDLMHHLIHTGAMPTNREEEIELKKQKEEAFVELAERFQTATDPEEIQQLGDELGKMIFAK